MMVYLFRTLTFILNILFTVTTTHTDPMWRRRSDSVKPRLSIATAAAEVEAAVAVTVRTQLIALSLHRNILPFKNEEQILDAFRSL